eukprot:CAMPEP_0118924672 /NCGR_PEP_ID=MMETSP1169-20130426/2700_1 /TAXON_ID=36882 /ORGANISM="Pyramimonas obovata, Strain CCMP722" /LENGTH=644 /DNA_ID=CAMNT_0006865803 /DNA_START=184 /DNA_END=2115 /DNA_ORIENTATION=+
MLFRLLGFGRRRRQQRRISEDESEEEIAEEYEGDAEYLYADGSPYGSYSSDKYAWSEHTEAEKIILRENSDAEWYAGQMIMHSDQITSPSKACVDLDSDSSDQYNTKARRNTAPVLSAAKISIDATTLPRHLRRLKRRSSLCSSIGDFEHIASDDERVPRESFVSIADSRDSHASDVFNDMVVVIRKDLDDESVERRLDRIYGEDPFLDHILPYNYVAKTQESAAIKKAVASFKEQRISWKEDIPHEDGEDVGLNQDSGHEDSPSSPTGANSIGPHAFLPDPDGVIPVSASVWGTPGGAVVMSRRESAASDPAMEPFHPPEQEEEDKRFCIVGDPTVGVKLSLRSDHDNLHAITLLWQRVKRVSKPHSSTAMPDFDYVPVKNLQLDRAHYTVSEEDVGFCVQVKLAERPANLMSDSDPLAVFESNLIGSAETSRIAEPIAREVADRSRHSSFKAHTASMCSIGRCGLNDYFGKSGTNSRVTEQTGLSARTSLDSQAHSLDIHDDAEPFDRPSMDPSSDAPGAAPSNQSERSGDAQPAEAVPPALLPPRDGATPQEVLRQLQEKLQAQLQRQQMQAQLEELEEQVRVSMEAASEQAQLSSQEAAQWANLGQPHYGQPPAAPGVPGAGAAAHEQWNRTSQSAAQPL